MGDDDSSTSTSDQTVSEPTSESASDAAPQIDSLDDIDASAPPATGGDASNGDGNPTTDSGDTNAPSVSVSDDTAHSDIQPPADPQQTTIGPDDGSGSGDGRPEEVHDKDPDDMNTKIEEDGDREADPEPPMAP